jgi:hypothetical protein
MALEIVGELIGAVLRVVGRMVFEILAEVFLYGTGRVLLSPFFRRGKEPPDWLCLIVGLLAWLTVVLAGWIAYSQFR